ncbi:hypothetical protein Taro_027614, partial [Colocasia esculenta]|nr:hypothetical protein [Colocasia esculenta]
PAINVWSGALASVLRCSCPEGKILPAAPGPQATIHAIELREADCLCINYSKPLYLLQTTTIRQTRIPKVNGDELLTVLNR